MSGTIVVIHPSGEEKEIRYEKSGSPPLYMFQQECGGYVERVRPKYKGRIRWAYVDEDGYSHRQAPNAKATSLLAETPWRGQTIVGPMCIWVPDGKLSQSS